VGGQERVALDLAVGQRAAGCGVVALSLAPPPDGPLAAEFAAAGIPIATVPKRAGFDSWLILRLARAFRRAHATIVHTHNPQPLIYGALAAQLARARIVHTKHGANPDTSRRLKLRRLAARLVHAYVAVSPTTATVAWQNREVDDKKLSVIPNGIDLSRFHRDLRERQVVRRELGIPPRAWVFGTVGRLDPEKDQALLVRAVEPLLGENARLVVVGDGEEAQRLRDLCFRLPQGRHVHWLGVRSDVPRLLSALDVFVLSSRTEGLPLVIPEAMAASLPVVSTSVGGIPGVIEDGVTGFLVPPGNEQALRLRLAELAKDRALAEDCGRKGRQVALERYSRERMVRDYMELYRRVLGLS